MDLNRIIQIGILVRDIESATKAWAAFLDRPVPVPSLTDGYDVTHAVYRGAPCHGKIFQTAFQLDNLELELISPADSETPSYWKECLDRDGEGLHHIAFAAENMEDSLRVINLSGFQTAQKGSWKDSPEYGQYAFADTRDALKCTIELLRFPQIPAQSNRNNIEKKEIS